MAVAAGLVAGFLGPTIQVVQWIGAPIKRQFTYLCCFSSNITGLRDEVGQLEVKAGDLQGKVDRARDDVRVISAEVEDWLKEFEKIKDENDTILKEAPTIQSSCLKLGARYSLSKRAMKTTARSTNLRAQCNFQDHDIAQPGPPPAARATPLPATCEFESRKQIEENIMATLRGGDVNIMGICGMGGAGKTTMAKRIMNKALKSKDKKENGIFDEVVLGVVSESVDISKIQLEIGGSLGLKELEKESSQSRVQKLYERLSGTKRILLVLDDVWKKIVLEDVGIPRNHEKCTILITSRNMDVLKEMDVQDRDVFGMKELSEVDAWNLFRWRAGPCVDNNKVNSIAKDVVKKCKGLPLALITVGAALKDKMNDGVWRNALRQLEDGLSDSDDVYNSLKLSYDFLRLPKHKKVFLLCGLYPEDADIPIEHLTYFCMGLGIFERGIVGEARDWMCSVIETLKDRSLLLDSDEGDDYVRMHDVVRDFSKFIAKEEGHDCTWISLSQRSELPSTFAFPNLRLLLLFGNWGDVKFELVNNFLEGINDLYVLSIQGPLLTSLPLSLKSLRSLKSLKTLVLYWCEELKTLSGVGELVNLEILICRCDRILELPPEMKELNRLKLLDLSRCYNLRRIGGGIISSLVALEELKMLDSFNKWEVEENASLKELGELKMLRCLEIDIQYPAALAAAEKMQLQSTLDRFHITLSCSGYSPEFDFHPFDSFGSYKKLKLRFDEENVKLGHWIEMQLLPHTEALYLIRGNVESLAKCEKLGYLELINCKNIKKIFMTPMDGLEHLKLWNLPKLEKIWDDDRVSSNSFQNLKEILLDGLSVLKHFGNDCLPQLEELRIVDCEIMEQVFLWKGESQNSHRITKVFPKLKKVELSNLPKLTSFYHGIDSIEFPQLSMLTIVGCAKMRSLVSKGMESNENNLGGSSSNANIHHLFCQPQEVSFGCLEYLATDRNPFCNDEIDISFLNGLKEILIALEGCTSFLTSSIAKNLCNLKKLTIVNCGEMAHLITDDENNGVSGGETTLLQFPKLQELILRELPKLVSFCKWKCDVELPSLREVNIHNCPNMENLTLGSLIAPNLESFDTDMDNELHLQAPFNSMKKLIFSKSEKPLNCDKIDVSHFNGLGELTISFYRGSMSVFPSSITGSLVNLTTLTIERCSTMVTVIEDDEEKENVGSSGQRRILFPRLQRLLLHYLHTLVNFCEWKCEVELPSLMEVKIWECDNMKRFTSGHLATPNLAIVRVDYNKDFGIVGDLNGLLQQVYEEKILKRGGWRWG